MGHNGSFYYSPYAYSPQHQQYGPTPYSPHPSYSLHDTSHQSQLSSSNSAMVQNSNGVYTFPSNGANAGAGSLTSSEKPSPPQSPAVESDGSQSTGAQRTPAAAGNEELFEKLWRLTLTILERSPGNEEWEWKQLRPNLKTEATTQFGESSWRRANTMGSDGWTLLKRLKIRLRNRPKNETSHNTASGTANGATNGIADTKTSGCDSNEPVTTTADGGSPEPNQFYGTTNEA